MFRKTSHFLQVGKMGIPLVVILLSAGLIFLLWVKPNPEWSEQNPVSVGNPACALDTDANPPFINAFTYQIEQNGCGPDSPGGDCSETTINDGTRQGNGVGSRIYPLETARYHRIKKDVLISERFFTGNNCGNPKNPEREQEGNACTNGLDVHFKTSGVEEYKASSDGKTYQVWYPRPENGKTYGFGNGQRSLTFAPYGLLFLVHPDQKAIDLDELISPNGSIWKWARMYKTDIYQQDGKPALPDYILDCTAINPNTTLTPRPTAGPNIVEPDQNKSPDEKQLQLQYFLFNQQSTVATSTGWWTPECKPAIYLYPEEKTNVHVQVDPKGFLTYTDPLYPKEGWKVTSYPDGTISSNGEEYPYLYYESKIRDSAIQKPEKGYMVSFGDLAFTFQNILPKLGLNPKETKEFSEYWLNALPFSPYYFVGVMDSASINEIEPLKITPKPATMIRVRLYFEAQSSWKKVEAPTFSAIERQGFTVSEWGGMVKLYDGEFTCSQ